MFLDVKMPFGNALNLLEQVKDIRFGIVFITAFSIYALQAINISTACCIIKQIDIDELIIDVEKIMKENKDKNQVMRAKILNKNIHNTN